MIEKVSVKLPPAPRTYWPEISVAVTVIFMKPYVGLALLPIQRAK